ncbi:MAG TPA: VTT domain-containing protein [Solirubrobacteraceae bacterium]|nr:VTT domain-containing protein [Solirubrobacteraceae bacterium]
MSGEASQRSPGPAGEPRLEHLRWREVAFSLAGVLAGAGLIAVVPDLRQAVTSALHGDLDGLREQFRGLGFGGVALLFGLMLAHAVLFYPTEIVTATAGFVYGFAPGLALAMGGWLASALLAYLLGHALGRPAIQLVFGARRFEELGRAIERGGASLLLVVRLIPVVPFSLTGYVAGAVRVPLWRFSWTTFLGYLPLTVIVGYLGAQAKTLSLDDPLVWLLAAAIVALFAASRLVLPAWRAPADADD